MPNNIFTDEDLEIEFVGMSVLDRQWLKQVGDIVTQNDFKPLGKGASIAWIIVGKSLEFFQKHRIPIGTLIGTEIAQYLKDSGASETRKQEFFKYLKRLKQRYDPERSAVLAEKALEFKKTNQRQNAILELQTLEQANELTDDKWLSIMRNALDGVTTDEPRDYFEELEQREERRRSMNNFHFIPKFGIDPLDSKIKGIGRGSVGLWIGYYKMGKSTALIHTAKWCVYQDLNVLYFTLEDPVYAVEDRLDANVTNTVIEELLSNDQVNVRFETFKKRIKTRLRIMDGTDGGMSVPRMEAIWERQRVKGFDADVVIVDYDDEIQPVVKRAERRQEFADIYRDLRKFAARKDLIIWTAAQTNRGSEGKGILAGKDVAEDISKIRKVTLALGIGQGEWGKESRCITVMGHKFDEQNWGTTIWTDLKTGSFYDQERTLQWIDKEKRSEKDIAN